MRPREYHDPVTGDVLTLSEFVSWRLQSMIRNWWFIGTITVITVLMFIKWKVWGHDPLDQWNYAASWLALWIESCVGIAMFDFYLDFFDGGFRIYAVHRLFSASAVV
jgi:hypothetical protein